MYCVIYKFKAKPGFEEQFEKNWRIHTDNIYKHLGSLGSRLHKLDEERSYMAYAQWPSKDVYASEKTEHMTQFSDADLLAQKNLADSLESSEVIFEGEVIDDRLEVVTHIHDLI